MMLRPICRYRMHAGSSEPFAIDRRPGSEFDTYTRLPPSNAWSRSSVVPDDTNTTESSRTRTPLPKTRSVRSKSPSANGASQTPSQTQSLSTSTPGPTNTVTSSEAGMQLASQASGGHDASGTVRSRTRSL